MGTGVTVVAAEPDDELEALSAAFSRAGVPFTVSTALPTVEDGLSMHDLFQAPVLLHRVRLPGLASSSASAPAAATALLEHLFLWDRPMVLPPLVECLRNHFRWPQRALAASLGLAVPASEWISSLPKDAIVPEGRIFHRPGQPPALPGARVPKGSPTLADWIVEGSARKLYFAQDRTFAILELHGEDWRPCEDPSSPPVLRYARAVGLAWGSLDYVETDRGAVFLEANPAPGFRPLGAQAAGFADAVVACLRHRMEEPRASTLPN